MEAIDSSLYTWEQERCLMCGWQPTLAVAPIFDRTGGSAGFRGPKPPTENPPI